MKHVFKSNELVETSRNTSKQQPTATLSLSDEQAKTSSTEQNEAKSWNVTKGTRLTLTAPWLSRNCHPAILSGKPVTLIFTGDGFRFGGNALKSDKLILSQPGTSDKVAGTYQLTALGMKHTNVIYSNTGDATLQTTYTGNVSHLDIIVDDQVVANFELQTLNAKDGLYHGRPMQTTIYFGNKDVTIIQTPQTTRFEDCRDTAKACPGNVFGCATAVVRTVAWPFGAMAGKVMTLLPDRSAKKAAAAETVTDSKAATGESDEAGFVPVDESDKKDN